MNEKNRIFGYIRVSTISQNIDRQLEEMLKLGIKKRNIYIDYQSGKDFERQNYQILKRKLKNNDLLIVKSIDRLGRNYEMIIQEWSDITKRIQADILSPVLSDFNCCWNPAIKVNIQPNNTSIGHRFAVKEYALLQCRKKRRAAVMIMIFKCFSVKSVNADKKIIKKAYI